MSVQLGPWDFVHARFPDMKLQMMESSPFEVIIFPSLCFSRLGYGTRRSLSPWKKGPPCTYCSAPRPVFVEKVLKETDWNSISSSILLGISTQVALKFFFPLHELVEMSQGCLIWRDLHIKQKFFIFHIPSSQGFNTQAASFAFSSIHLSASYLFQDCLRELQHPSLQLPACVSCKSDSWLC